MRAERAREAAAYRLRLLERWRENEKIWLAVEAARRPGEQLAAAFWRAAGRLGRRGAAAAPPHAEGAWRGGRHKRRRRDLEIARRAAAGESYAAIGADLGLHGKSVGRIVRQFLAALEKADD